MEILGHKLLYRDGEYVAFPNMERLADGTVIATYVDCQTVNTVKGA